MPDHVSLTSEVTRITRRVDGALKYRQGEKTRDQTEGQTQGSINQPQAGQPYLFAENLIEDVNATLEKAREGLQTVKNRAREWLGGCEIEINRNNEKRENLKEKYDSDIGHLDQNRGPMSQGREELRERRENSRQALDDLRFRLGGRACKARWRRAYSLVLIGVAIIEVPINRVAFTSLVTTNWEALSAGLLVGVIVALLAHLIGVQWRRCELKRKHFEGRHRLSHLLPYVWLSSSIIIALILFRFITELRDYTFRLGLVESASLREIVAEDFIEGLWDMDITSQGWGLFVLNCLVLLVGAYFAYRANDPHPDYVNHVRDEEKWRKKLKAWDSSYDKKEKDLTGRWNAKNRILESEYAKLNSDKASLETVINNISNHFDRLRGRSARYIRRRINHFENTNRQARTDVFPPEFDEFGGQMILDDRLLQWEDAPPPINVPEGPTLVEPAQGGQHDR